LLRVAKVTPYNGQYDDVVTANAVYPSVHPSRVRGDWGLRQGRSRRDVRPCVTCRSAAGSRSRATWCESGSQFSRASSRFRVADRGASRGEACESGDRILSAPSISVVSSPAKKERANRAVAGSIRWLQGRADYPRRVVGQQSLRKSALLGRV